MNLGAVAVVRFGGSSFRSECYFLCAFDRDDLHRAMARVPICGEVFAGAAYTQAFLVVDSYPMARLTPFVIQAGMVVVACTADAISDIFHPILL